MNNYGHLPASLLESKNSM